MGAVPLWLVAERGASPDASLIGWTLAGALVYASVPHTILGAKNLALRAMGTASRMLMGFAPGVAAMLYVGIGWLHETVGMAPAI